MQWLFETKAGDLLCWLVEHVLGCALVPLSQLEYRVEATAKGKAATSGAPASSN